VEEEIIQAGGEGRSDGARRGWRRPLAGWLAGWMRNGLGQARRRATDARYSRAAHYVEGTRGSRAEQSKQHSELEGHSRSVRETGVSWYRKEGHVQSNWERRKWM
jgi:hypothetical protein